MAVETNYPRGVAFIGAVHQHPVEVVDTTTGAPENMTGWELAYVLRTLADVLVFSKTEAGGIVIGNGAGTNSKATITWARADTQTALEGWHNWSIWRVDDPSDQPLAYGRIYLTKAAAQP